MATVYEIIQGINQAAANAYDGAHDERYSYDGKARKVGLKREEGDCITTSRGGKMDGFNVRFHGDKMILSYQSEIPLKDFHDRSFENDTEAALNDVIKYLKKEYKSITGNSVTLTADGDAKIHAQTMSRKRTWVQASKSYKVGGMKGVEPVGAGSSEDRLDKAIESFLSIGKKEYPGAKKPKNVKNTKSK
tara:strand:- start:8033 stop:8602 length:570 start_codon:yes stop_codon:yes gene_type:complete